MDNFLKDFLTETKEDLDKIEKNLVSLDDIFSAGEDIDYDLVNNIFRHFHSVKGSSGFFGLTEIVRVAHQGENILDLFRKRKLEVKPDYLDVIFRVRDFIGELVQSVEANGNDKGMERKADTLIEELKLLEGTKQKLDAPAETIKKEKKFGFFAPLTPSPEVEAEVTNIVSDENPAAAPIIPDSGAPAVRTLLKEPKPNKTKKWGLFDDAPKEEILKPPLELDEKKKLGQVNELKDIRISTERLDTLMDLLGELVIVDAMTNRYTHAENLNVELIQRSATQLSKITRYLLEVGLSMRMVAVSGIFQKMSRLVRDLSRKSGKQVKFEIKGEESEIDKTLIEQLSDPLMHIIRNALDHGMETTEERLQTNKPAMGRISMEASHKGSEIWIEIKDDGRGLNRTKILKKARENALIETDGSELTDNQVWDLIFRPGFSTAEKITDISGRGVGMDVVKKNISRLKGKVDVESVFGHGSTFYLRIPLTLAIVEAMVVKYSGGFYIIPTENIERFIDLTVMEVSDIYDDQTVVRIGNHLVSVVDLNEIFSFQGTKGARDQRVAVVIGREGHFVALPLDAIIGSQQVVVKPLDERMEHVKGLSGTAILGEGEIGLILDTDYIINMYIGSAKPDPVLSES